MSTACWFCADKDSAGLVAPCSCDSGVHRECLAEFVASTGFSRCCICGQPYNDVAARSWRPRMGLHDVSDDALKCMLSWLSLGQLGRAACSCAALHGVGKDLLLCAHLLYTVGCEVPELPHKFKCNVSGTPAVYRRPSPMMGDGEPCGSLSSAVTRHSSLKGLTTWQRSELRCCAAITRER